MTRCFLLNSIYSEISNNKYIFNNLFPTSPSTNISYGLYDNTNSINYVIRNEYSNIDTKKLMDRYKAEKKTLAPVKK